MILGGGASSVGEAVSGVIRTVSGDKAEEARQDHEKFAAAMTQFAAEFTHSRRSWFDSLVDGLNRLPRPFLAFGVMGGITWAAVDPIAFTAAMTALSVVPDPLWYLAGIIVAFFFGAKQVKDLGSMRAATPERVGQVLETMGRINAMRPSPPPDSAPVPAPDPHENLALAEIPDDLSPPPGRDHNAALAEFRASH